MDRIRLLTYKDARSVAALHIKSISRGFISSLGIDIVTSLYKAIARNKNSFGFVAVDENKVLGFVVFTNNIKSLYLSVILKSGLHLMLLFARKALSVQRIKNALETLFYPSRTGKMKLPEAELLSIAIVPEERGQGLASQLIKKGFQCCRKKGIDEVKVLIGAANEPGNKLYLKSGFELVGQIVNHGIVSNIYVARTDSAKQQ
jgi:ribosomal protein S18 acetylase RimI-like enzyme